jgi:hypothetical protein
MGELPRCMTCGLRLSESRADEDRWVDADGWFVGEEPLLHAHRPISPPDVVIVLSGSATA